MGYAYLDYSGVLHITKHEDIAKEYGQKGVYIETDLPAGHGYPVDKHEHSIILTKEELYFKEEFYFNNRNGLCLSFDVHRAIKLYKELDKIISYADYNGFIDVVKSIFRKDLL